MAFFSTRQVAEIFQIKPDMLSRAVWLGKVKPPLKSPQGSYLWNLKDIEAAAWAMHRYAEFVKWQEKRNV